MLNVRPAGDHQFRKLLAVAGDVFDGVFVLSFSHEFSWMRSGTELRQSLRIFLPSLSFIWCVCCVKGSRLPLVCGIKYD